MIRKTEKTRRGFTLIELLVVVLIIGILSAVALPQYQKAVDKSRVATMLPLMRRWIDAMALYKLENGSYMTKDEDHPTADMLGVSWPKDGAETSYGLEYTTDLWYCYANEEHSGYVYCESQWKASGQNFTIMMTQPDDPDYPQGTRFCRWNVSFCKSLGGKEIAGYSGYYEF